MDEEKTIDDGGSLYPTDTAAGMSMRDYFASDQTAALLSRIKDGVEYNAISNIIPNLVDLGYAAADAMIERRKQ